jgi:hypothetical protein
MSYLNGCVKIFPREVCFHALSHVSVQRDEGHFRGFLQA